MNHQDCFVKIYLCVYYVYMYTVSVRGAPETNRTHQVPGTGVLCGCELLCGCQKLNLGSL